ncbi:MAG: arginase [Candidatus Azotimanducaceae bacterium]|jgi:arginase
MINSNNVVLVDMPFDDYSSHLKGPAKAPPIIREMMKSDVSNTSTELGLELGDHPNISNYEDLLWTDSVGAFQVLSKAIDEIGRRGDKPFTFGGDHSITYPIIESLAKHAPEFTILHFDAHPDLYDILDNNPLSHACPFARIMEKGLAKHLIQIGIRTLNQHQREQVERFKVEVHEMKDWGAGLPINLEGPVYISVDIDALDPAFAPGVSHHEPGGLSVRHIIDVIHAIKVPIIGADIVEYNPTRDFNLMTAAVVNKLYKEICGKMLMQ